MQADPRLGILQHLTVGGQGGDLGVSSVVPVFRHACGDAKLGRRAGIGGKADEGTRTGATTQSIRIALLRSACEVAAAAGRAVRISCRIDQVEAALLRAAGWGVRVLVDEDGLFEAFPPALRPSISALNCVGTVGQFA